MAATVGQEGKGGLIGAKREKKEGRKEGKEKGWGQKTAAAAETESKATSRKEGDGEHDASLILVFGTN